VITKKAGLNSYDGIDIHFLKKARDDNKEILEVESVTFQYELLTGFSDELYDLIIKAL